MTLAVPSRQARRFEVEDLGVVDYAAGLAAQEAAIEEARRTKRAKLLFVEHPHVYTIGRGGDASNLGGAPERLGVPLHRVSRGGDATYHGPGQVVGYPIVPLEGEDRDVHRFLRRLEDVLIRTIAAFGIDGRRVGGRTGVWTGNEHPRKIASLGIGVRRWITWHGFALNVATDLRYFREIVPCGIPGVEMTSLERETGGRVDLSAVKQRLTETFAEVFDRTPARPAIRGRAWAGRISAATPGVSGERKPAWIRARVAAGETYFATRRVLSDLDLRTVCEEAMCPNLGECWSHSTATFMLMGDACTRSCGFCAVKHGAPLGLDPLEPGRVAKAAAELGLRHVVVTSVNRDDLADGGAEHFAATARAIKHRAAECTVEVLIPDFQGDSTALHIVATSPIDVLNHNTETVPRLYPRVRPGAKYARTLELLASAKRIRPALLVKSGVMVGLGEADHELESTFRDLRATGCDILTVGQYLRPTKDHLPVDRFVTPETFAAYRECALALGFRHVESGPLVRSSYHAWDHVEGARATLADSAERV